MKNKKRYLGMAFLVTAVVVFGTMIGVRVGQPPEPQREAQAQQADTAKKPKEISYTVTKGENILDRLKEEAQVVTKDSDYGKYVDTIDGVKGGTDGKYWSYYIDGKVATQGVDAYKVQGGEVVTWKFE